MMLRLMLTSLLLLAPASAQAAWTRATTDHFVFYGDLQPDRLQNFAEKLERFDTVLRKITGAGDATVPGKLTVFVVRDAATVQKQLPGGGKGIQGFYQATITGAFAVVPRSVGTGGQYDIDAETVLFHEYIHHFMLQNFPAGYPGWYVEGFAEYLSTVEFRRDGEVAVGLPAKHRFYDLMVTPMFPVKRMFAADPGKMTQEEMGAFYAWSWLLTHYLGLSPARKGQLTTYLNAFSKGVPPEEAAKQAFGDLAVLQKDLSAYRDGRRLSYIDMKNQQFPTYKVDLAPLTAAQSAMMPLFLHFTQGSNGKAQVEQFAVDARANAARNPEDPLALELLAEGELDAERFDAATKANDALLAKRPTDARALLRRARIAAARLGGDGTEAQWKEVRGMIVKANRANPDDAWPLMLFYQSYARAGQRPPEIAGQGLQRALELAPQAGELRFMLAGRLMSEGKRDDARFVLGPLLNEPHSASIRDAARAMLDGKPAPEQDKAKVLEPAKS